MDSSTYRMMYDLCYEMDRVVRKDEVELAMQMLDDHPELFDYVETMAEVLWQKCRNWQTSAVGWGSQRMILAMLSRPNREEAARFIRMNHIEVGGILSILCFRSQESPEELADFVATVIEYARRIVPIEEFLHLDYEGRNACNAAVECGNVRILKLLQAAGASISVTDTDGMHLGHYATMEGSNMEMLEYIYTIDPENVTRPDNFGRLPLHMAVENNVVSMCKFLLQQYPEGLETRCNRGRTPLAYAVSWRNRDVIIYLLRRGADPRIPTVPGPHFDPEERRLEITRLVAACTDQPSDLTDDEILAIRSEIFFSESLVERILSHL